MNKADSLLLKLIAAERYSCFPLSSVLGVDNESESDTECHFRGFHWKFTVFIGTRGDNVARGILFRVADREKYLAEVIFKL